MGGAALNALHRFDEAAAAFDQAIALAPDNIDLLVQKAKMVAQAA